MQEQTETRLLQELVKNLAGKNTEQIVDILGGKKDVNEFKIAEKLGITVNQVRNILYKLYAHNIASFMRKKDKQKGWYIYYWTLNTIKALEKLIALKKKEIENLRYQLTSRETKRFFSCPSCGIELNEETALQYNFLCPECGQLLKLTLKEKKIEEIKKAIGDAKKHLMLTEQELAKIMEKEEKKAARKRRKEEKLRKKARKAKRKPKKKVKKKVKKKPKKLRKAKRARIKKIKRILKKIRGKKKVKRKKQQRK